MADDTDNNEVTQEEAVVEALAEEDALEDAGLEDAPELAEAEAIALENGPEDLIPELREEKEEAEAKKDGAPVPPAEVDAPKAETDQVDKPAEKKTCPLNGREKGFVACKLIVGTVLIIAGIWVLVQAHVDVDSAAFGADFYTYTYQAIVNVAQLLNVIAVALGWLLIGYGAHMDISVFRPRPHHPHLPEPKQD